MHLLCLQIWKSNNIDIEYTKAQVFYAKLY
jgi:hypothetical protein